MNITETEYINTLEDRVAEIMSGLSPDIDQLALDRFIYQVAMSLNYNDDEMDSISKVCEYMALEGDGTVDVYYDLFDEIKERTCLEEQEWYTSMDEDDRSWVETEIFDTLDVYFEEDVRETREGRVVGCR